MRRIVLLLVAALLCALASAPAADAAADAKKPAAPKRVCVVKVVKKATKTRKAVRKKVCRPAKKKRAATAKTPASAPSVPALSPRPWIEAGGSAPAPAPTAPGGGSSSTPSAPKTPSLPPADVPLTPVGEQPPAAPSPVCPDDSPWLGAFAREDVKVGFRIDLSRTCIRAGRVIVRYLNTDSTVHNLWVREEGSGAAPRKVLGGVTPQSQDSVNVPPGQQDGSVDLTPGTWRFYCSLPGHEVMARDITVTPAG